MRAAVSVIPNDGPPDWEAWTRIGLLIWAATKGDPEGLEIYMDWSEQRGTSIRTRLKNAGGTGPRVRHSGGVRRLFMAAKAALATAERGRDTGGAEFADHPQRSSRRPRQRSRPNRSPISSLCPR